MFTTDSDGFFIFEPNRRGSKKRHEKVCVPDRQTKRVKAMRALSNAIERNEAVINWRGQYQYIAVKVTKEFLHEAKMHRLKARKLP